MDGGWIEYFFQHRRGYFIFDTAEFGHVAMACVGMFTISSVNFIVGTGQAVNKGTELGNFQYGGSAVILLFEPGRVQFSLPLTRPTPVLMGQQIGTAVPLPPEPYRETAIRAGGGSTGTSNSVAVVKPGPVSLANVNVRSVTLSASTVAPGQPVTVTADVVNNGTGNGEARVTLYVNGQEESSQGVSVASGGSAPVTFTLIRSEPGTYSVYAGGVPGGAFTVDASPQPAAVLVISSLLVLTALVLGVVYARRRA
jgi:hypothetical protein